MEIFAAKNARQLERIEIDRLNTSQFVRMERTRYVQFHVRNLPVTFLWSGRNIWEFFHGQAATKCSIVSKRFPIDALE